MAINPDTSVIGGPFKGLTHFFAGANVFSGCAEDILSPAQAILHSNRLFRFHGKHKDLILMSFEAQIYREIITYLLESNNTMYIE